MEQQTEATYRVEGMTCGHCALSVREEVSEVVGVRDVDVDVESGRLTVSGDGFSDEHVKDAVEEAGYRMASR
jgi:copper chaperone CopZ